MVKISKIHLLLIAGGVLLGILVYLAPHISPENRAALDESLASHQHEEGENEGQSHTTSTEVEVEKGEVITSLEQRWNTEQHHEKKMLLIDSLIDRSIKEKKPPLVAKYTEEKAILLPTEENWMASGDNYYKAFRFSEKKSAKLVQKAIDSYEKVLEINPENLSAESSLGVAYIEGAALLGEMPMKGVGILLKILEKDPNNINALTNLGYFAIQSGQYEKAIERFDKVLEIEAENAEAYLYLTDIYVSMGDYEKGIENLEKYKSLVKDPLVEKQVDVYIEDLRNK